MTWIKLDDTYPDHPKVLEVGDHAAWLYVAGLCYSSRHLLDGFIPARSIAKLTSLPKSAGLAARLVTAGMWDVCEGGWQIHNYDKHQRTREQVTEAREAASRRQSRRRHAVTSGEVTRPEKRREEKTNPPTPLPGGSRRDVVPDFERFPPHVLELKRQLEEPG